MFTKDFDVYWESWNNSGTGNYDTYPVTKLYVKKYFGAMFDTMCEFDGMLIAKLNAATLKDGTEPVEGQYYQETDTYPVNMLMFFALVDEEIVLQDSPITDENININGKEIHPNQNPNADKNFASPSPIPSVFFNFL